MAANLSDLAAMGAQRLGLLSLGLPPGPGRSWRSWWAPWTRGPGLRLSWPGDTVKAPQVLINLCLLGVMGNLAPLLRSGGRRGDAVCVTGTLGGSAAGLAWLRAGRDPGDPAAAPAVAAYRRPVPRVEVGRALAASGQVRAMMDLSDGLASDLARLARASGLGARVEAALVPVAPAAQAVAGVLGSEALGWALAGGEDFELLFTCDPGEVGLLAELVAETADGLAVTRVGRLSAGPGVILNHQGKEEPISYMGYDHFREAVP